MVGKMKKIRAVILGYGNRSYCYSRHAVNHPDELEIIGVIDVNPMKLELAKTEFSLSPGALYGSLDEFLRKNIDCDVIINGTMDQYHYETSVKILERGYNMLLEKPITADPKELFEIEALARKNGCEVLICHVLRYTPFYSEIKKIIDSGEIGSIISMQLNEHVWYGHFVDAYVRGKWRNEKECGSGLLLAKCCHDADLICWLNNSSTPTSVSSFGSRSFFTENNAPQGAAEYCVDCPAKQACAFEAVRFHVKHKTIDDYVWAEINKPISDITEEEKIEYLKRGTYGRCVYKMDMDIVDRQCVNVEFENGSVATLNLTTGGLKAGRHIHVICEMGEIVGYVEENKFTLRRYDKDAKWYTEEVIDFSKSNKLTGKNQAETGHYGGDARLMADLCRFLNGEATSVSTTVIEDSVNSHLVCYAAEESRKNKRVSFINEFKNR